MNRLFRNQRLLVRISVGLAIMLGLVVPAVVGQTKDDTQKRKDQSINTNGNNGDESGTNNKRTGIVLPKVPAVDEVWKDQKKKRDRESQQSQQRDYDAQRQRWLDEMRKNEKYGCCLRRAYPVRTPDQRQLDAQREAQRQQQIRYENQHRAEHLRVEQQRAYQQQMRQMQEQKRRAAKQARKRW